MRAALTLAGAAAALAGSVTLPFDPATVDFTGARRFAAVVGSAAGAFPPMLKVVELRAGDAAPPAAAATASVLDHVSEEGWAYLSVQSNASWSDGTQAYAAGYLEGAVTQQRIYQSFVNQGYVNATIPTAVADWLASNEGWMDAQIAAYEGHDAFWHHVGLARIQMRAIFDGYASAAPPAEALNWNSFYVANLGNDMGDIAAAVGLQVGDYDEESGRARSGKHYREWAVPPSTRNGADGVMQPSDNGRCSALARLLPGNADVLVSQSTWSSFESMLRIYKSYELPFCSDASATCVTVPGVNVAESGYPGVVYSGDDWYTIRSAAGAATEVALVVLETTIGASNGSLYREYVKPTTVLDCHRNVVANRLATSGPTWSSTFSRYNSGTYNNEFFVLDFTKFTPGSPPQPDFFWLLDQIPGFINASDVTATFVADGYIGSYNVAYYPFIFNISGMPALVQQYGPWFSHDYTARANIFRRDAPKVTDEASFARLMRYNDFTHDPLSTQGCEGSNPPYSSENAIACRDDLNPANGTYKIGALGHRDHCQTDAKFTSYARMMGTRGVVTSVIQGGPTWDTQPPFVFSNSTITGLSYLGMPDGPWTMPWRAISWPLM